MHALIVGNGLTRKPYNFRNFRNHTVFACNAAYRDFADEIDYLCAIDEKITQEILASSFPKEKFILTPYEEQFESSEYGPNRFRNNAAMVAMQEAIKRGFTFLNIIGCDFMIEDKALNMANVYENTNAYGPETRASYYDTISRCRYMDWFASQNQHVVFQFLFPKQNTFRMLASPNILVKVHDSKLHL